MAENLNGWANMYNIGSIWGRHIHPWMCREPADRLFIFLLTMLFIPAAFLCTIRQHTSLIETRTETKLIYNYGKTGTPCLNQNWK